MFFRSIKIRNFRNYKILDLDLSMGINIIYGNNAQGKTNLLESIYFLAFSKSHRSFIDHSLINDSAKDAYICGNLMKDEDYKMEIGINDQNKKLKINNSEIKKISEYISLANIIIFYPEDLNLIKGSPKERRRFLNTEISQIYSNYLDIVNDYNKLLKIRNEYLKKMQQGEKIDDNYFDILNNYFISKATDIYILRYKFINRINEFIKDIYKDIINIDNFYIKYKSSIDIENQSSNILKKLEEALIKERDNEIKYGSTLIGPHRDDFVFQLDNQDLRNYGSQGQQRVAVLALKLAEIKVFQKYKNIDPIILLDDVFSELDDIKKNNLLKYIDKKLQVIITTTDLNNIDKKLLKKAKKIKIENANIVNVEEVE